MAAYRSKIFNVSSKMEPMFKGPSLQERLSEQAEQQQNADLSPSNYEFSAGKKKRSMLVEMRE